jgi:Zn ribbon nucleic-acid-binding protein
VAGDQPADNEGMQPYLVGNANHSVVECLRCGHQRACEPARRRSPDVGECPRCAYVGWASSEELTERTRRLVREYPVERRLRLRAA